MDAKDLMIGDIVSYDGYTGRIHTIEGQMPRKEPEFDNKTVIGLVLSGILYTDIDGIEPIPLTEEILKANGFDDWDGESILSTVDYEILENATSKS